MKVSTFRASFGDVDARLIADASGFAWRARPASRRSRSPTRPQFREHVVRGADFFDADNHPEILFRSQRVELADNGTATVDGELTIKASAGRSRRRGRTSGRSRIHTAPCGAGLELRAVLDRRDWGMSWQQPLPGGADAVGWEVELTVQLELVKQP